MRVRMKRCRQRLAILWAVGASVPFVVLLLQSIFGHYRGQSQRGLELASSIRAAHRVADIRGLATDAVSATKTTHVEPFAYRFAAAPIERVSVRPYRHNARRGHLPETPQLELYKTSFALPRTDAGARYRFGRCFFGETT